MSRKLLMAILAGVLGLSAVASAETPSNPVVVERLAGSWEGEGELFGRPVTFSMSWCTTYRLIGHDRIEVLDEVRSDDDWRPFGRATYRRVTTASAAPGETKMMRAAGSFDIQMKPLETHNQSPDAEVGRMSIDKTFEGDLIGASQGEMLSGGSPASGSAGYVAIERVTGTLGGRQGSFTLQHSGTMTPDSRSLTITVVPASGTDELEGLQGTMDIDIRDGQHFYTFEYTLRDA